MEDSRGWLSEKVKRLERHFSSSHSGLLEKERERLFVKNGSKLLEELITSCKDKCRCNPIRSFSAKQLLEATNESESYFFHDYNYRWYKGTMDDRPVLINKYHRDINNQAYRDITISSQMSSHKNSLKLLGCCLEFSEPALVYEDIENRPLGSMEGIASDLLLSWKLRLKVAKEMANAITFSITIPEGKTHFEDKVTGTVGFVDPSYLATSIVTEHTDVYSFGVLLLILLTGQDAYDSKRPTSREYICNYVEDMVEQERFKEILDPKILEEEGDMNEVKELQLQAFLKLALICTNPKREDRPLMIEVAKELVKIERSAR